MNSLVEQNLGQIRELCQKYQVKRLELFGSAARNDFNPETSDLDFFVEFEAQDWRGSAKRYFGLLHGLEDLLHRRIDLVDRAAELNPYFLIVAEQDMIPLYAGSLAKAS